MFPGLGAGPGVGRPAPETEGPDADGKFFRLSDYRGKVVLLDFWGDF
jgi:peroxiredoxin